MSLVRTIKMIKKKGIIAYLNEYNRTTGSRKNLNDVYYS